MSQPARLNKRDPEMQSILKWGFMFDHDDKMVMKAYNEWVEDCCDNIDFEEYIRYSTLLQINDDQIREFMIPKCGKLGIINYDLYLKIPEQNVYGILIPNEYDDHWKLAAFLTADMIEWNFSIQSHELPKSSRAMPYFSKQLLSPRPLFDDNLVDNIHWPSVPHNKANKDHFSISSELDNKLWIRICKDSIKDHNLPCIPIVKVEIGHHFIQWVQIIYDKTEKVYYNLAFKYINVAALVIGYDREQNLSINVSDAVLSMVMIYCGDMIAACERDISLDCIRSGNKLLASQSGLVLPDNEFNKYRRLSNEELCINDDGSCAFAYPPYSLDNIE